MESVHIDHVQKTFHSDGQQAFTVFQDINLHIQPGEFVSLLGPSGCGKSTLLNLVAGLETATTGNIQVGERVVQGPGSDRGVVFQDPALMPWLTILENVLFGLKKKMGKAEAEERSLEYLKLVHLSKFVHAYPHELSGGMKQRVAIARALAMDPKILLMDEPFGALDEQTRLMLQGEVENIWKKTGKTIIFVTHNIRESISLSDRVVLMGTRPGGILDIFPVDLPRPRQTTDPAFTALEEKIMSLLAGEIDKVMREEMGDGYNLEKSTFLRGTDHHLGNDRQNQ